MVGYVYPKNIVLYQKPLSAGQIQAYLAENYLLSGYICNPQYRLIVPFQIASPMGENQCIA